MQKGFVKEDDLRIEKIRNQKRKRAKRAKEKKSALKSRQSDAKKTEGPENVVDFDS